MLVRLQQTRVQRQMQTSAAARPTLAEARDRWPAKNWPQRPDPSILSRSIPLFFISRDSDGFWIACEADFRIGGVFLSQRSAMRFAQRCSTPTRCATMLLEEPYNLEIENRGNRLIAQLRPVKRLLKRLASKIRSIGSRLSRAYIEDRMLHAALEVELYRGRYRYSNKNDDDLPIVTENRAPRHARNKLSVADNIKRAWPVAFAFAIFALILVGIIALRVMIWLPTFQR